MIDRNTPNNELLSNIHGLYTDYRLLVGHTRTSIAKYLDKHFPDEEEKPFSSSTVWITGFEYDTTFDSFSVEISSKELLTRQEIEDFSKEFELKLNQVNRVHSGFYDLFLDDNYLQKAKNCYYTYCFSRKKEIYGYL